MNQEVKVSIICNVYNHGQYLRDALEGFVNQKTDFLFEILVHDDASTDNSPEIIREYEEKHPDLIKPIYQTENQYSKCMWPTIYYQTPRAKGKYIATCEGDDYWIDPLKLQKQYDFMESHPEYTMCAGSTRWLNLKTGQCEKRCFFESDTDVSLEDLIVGTPGNYFHYSAFFVKTDIFAQYPQWRSLCPIGDYPLMLLAGMNGKVHVMADEMSVYRYFAENSWTVRTDNDERRARVSRDMIKSLEMLNQETQFRYEKWVRQRINRHKYTLALMEHDLKSLRSDELKEMFRSRSFVHRTVDVIRCRFPGFYNKALKSAAQMVKSLRERKK